MSYSQKEIDDIAYGKRVVTPKMRRAKRWQSFKSGAGKVARATGKGLKYIGKETYASGKYVYKDIKSTRPKIKPINKKSIKQITHYKKKGKKYYPVYKKVKVKLKKVKKIRKGLSAVANYDFEMPKLNFV